jgi:hypothetical protein
MIQELIEIKDTESVSEMCTRFGTWLGSEKPVPEPVLLRALDDPGYASDLITCRNAPAFLEALFTDPRNAAWAPAPAPAAEPVAGSAGNLELVGRAAQAFLRWGNAGFSTVDPATLERRENACLACPHLSEPDRLLQRLAGRAAGEQVGSRTGKRVCGRCGCNVGKKMRLSSESCPELHPTLVGLTRWGEPAAQPA